MTNSIVPSITDEQLEEIEHAIRFTLSSGASSKSAIYLANTTAAIIARLRAAEADAKRYRWLRNPSTDPASVIDKRVADSATGFGIWEYKAGDELDDAIDAAMERTP